MLETEGSPTDATEGPSGAALRASSSEASSPPTDVDTPGAAWYGVQATPNTSNSDAMTTTITPTANGDVAAFRRGRGSLAQIVRARSSSGRRKSSPTGLLLQPGDRIESSVFCRQFKVQVRAEAATGIAY